MWIGATIRGVMTAVQRAVLACRRRARAGMALARIEWHSAFLSRVVFAPCGPGDGMPDTASRCTSPCGAGPVSLRAVLR